MFFGVRFLSVSISRRVTKPARGTYVPRVFSFSNMAVAGRKSLGTWPGTRLTFGTYRTLTPDKIVRKKLERSPISPASTFTKLKIAKAFCAF